MTDHLRRRGAVALALLAATACSRKPAAGSAGSDSTVDARKAPMVLSADEREHLKIVPAASVTYRPTIVTTGTVAFDGDLSTSVLAPISGPVVRILVEVGTVVRQGDVLAVLSSPDFAAAVSAYKKAEAAAEQAQRVAELNAQLFKADGIAKRDYDQSVVDAESAAADRDAALQALRALGVDSASIARLKAGTFTGQLQATIRAPLDGTVVEKLINPGQLIQAGSTPCFTVADLSRMWVLANVFESDLPFVAKGDRADITGAAIARPIPGVADYVAALVDPATRATTVRIEAPNPGHVLKKDMYVQVSIQSTRSVTNVLVPVAAVLRDDDNLPFVFVEGPPGSFSRRAITLGNRVGDKYEVLQGLKDGEQVIAEGGLFLEFAQDQ
jgi:membrane fusion protein, heavy metal efflux system